LTLLIEVLAAGITPTTADWPLPSGAAAVVLVSGSYFTREHDISPLLIDNTTELGTLEIEEAAAN
jgi:hypothetical protein